ncbi:MAG: hypothetical protein M3335_00440 [Actinomycetota bacterium]|nr:hypothetical protein [Actinomycetota bacterium]
MAVMAREAWTDERLDELNERVAGIDRRMEAGFAELRVEIKGVREEMRTEFVAVAAEFVAVRKEMYSGFTALRAEMATQFAAQNRMMIQLFGGMFATFVVGTLGTIATIIAQT